jgi:peptide/nickel transport system permease protein
VGLGITKWQPELLSVDWATAKYDFAIRALIPYSPLTKDWDNSNYVSPLAKQDVEGFSHRHLLGTDQLGRDLLAGLIHGTRIAMMVGIVSVSIATIIGIFLGAIAGYFGDEKLKLKRIELWFALVGLVVAWFYAFNVRSYVLSDALSDSFSTFVFQFIFSIVIFTAIVLAFFWLAKLLVRIPFLGKEITIPMDIIISRFIEVLNSIPTLLLILSICAIMKRPSILMIMVIIGFTSWTGIAKYIRAEMLKIRSLEYIEAAQSLGYNEMRIMFRHAIPNGLTSVLISVAFGVAGAILAESTLSFLGIGVQSDVVTWGKLLNAAREDVKAWWFAVFPGLAIFITITAFNLLGDGLTDALDPRLKQ